MDSGNHQRTLIGFSWKEKCRDGGRRAARDQSTRHADHSLSREHPRPFMNVLFTRLEKIPWGAPQLRSRNIYYCLYSIPVGLPEFLFQRSVIIEGGVNDVQ